MSWVIMTLDTKLGTKRETHTHRECVVKGTQTTGAKRRRRMVERQKQKKFIHKIKIPLLLRARVN